MYAPLQNFYNYESPSMGLLFTLPSRLFLALLMSRSVGPVCDCMVANMRCNEWEAKIEGLELHDVKCTATSRRL